MTISLRTRSRAIVIRDNSKVVMAHLIRKLSSKHKEILSQDKDLSHKELLPQNSSKNSGQNYDQENINQDIVNSQEIVISEVENKLRN